MAPVAACVHPQVNSDQQVTGAVSENSMVESGCGRHRGSRENQFFCPSATADSQVRMSSPVMVMRAPEYSSIREAMRYTPNN